MMGGLTNDPSNGANDPPVHSIEINRKDTLNRKLAGQGITHIKTNQAAHETGGVDGDNEEIAAALSNNHSNGKGDADGDPGQNQLSFPDDMTMLQCFWMVTKMAIPLVVGMLLYLLVQLANTYFVGNLNEPALLAGVGMGNMLINVLCFAII